MDHIFYPAIYAPPVEYSTCKVHAAPHVWRWSWKVDHRTIVCLRSGPRVKLSASGRRLDASKRIIRVDCSKTARSTFLSDFQYRVLLCALPHIRPDVHDVEQKEVLRAIASANA